MANNFIKEYGKVVVGFLFAILFLVPNFSFADVQCSKDGYTVATINGINTTRSEAGDNMDALRKKLDLIWKGSTINYQFFYNPTHGKIVDGLAATVQKIEDQSVSNVVDDSDFAQILTDASKEVTTQKLLVVGHSQGNFYANAFYNTVVGVSGGIPSQSISVYSVATPANRISGINNPNDTNYTTSDSDTIIDPIPYILKPNIHINFKNSDDSGQGHSFSTVYMSYAYDKITHDMVLALNKLQSNNIQNENSPCINPPKLTLAQKVQGAVLAVVDPISIPVQAGVVNTAVAFYDAGAYIRDGASNVGLAIGSFLHNTTLSIASLISNDTKNLAANIGGLNIGGNVIDALDDSANTAQNTDPKIPKDKSIHPDASVTQEEGNNPIVVESPLTTPPNTEATPPYSGADNLVQDSAIVPSGTDLTQDNVSTGTSTLLSGSGGTTTTPDITPPVITIIGANPVTINVGDVYTDLGATATDDVDGDITANIVTVNPVDVNKIADYTITYNIKDVAENSALQIDRLVHVVAPPLVTTIIDQDTILEPGEYNYENLVITNHAILTLLGDPTSADSFKGVKINAVNITIDAGASISANGKGYGPDQGPGISSVGAFGAGYGGKSYGNVAGNDSKTYGSVTKPIDLGSGGTGRGGGAIHLVVSDTFTNKGVVSADGDLASSGGSIYVIAKNIAGSGTVRAEGGAIYGNGSVKSPGGGGRIALYYKNSSFNGTIDAKGGGGSYDGINLSYAQNGTVGVFDESSNDIFLNGSWKFIQADAPFNFNNIYISNGANVSSESGVNINANNILVDKNSYFNLAENQILNIPTITVDGGSILTLSGSETIIANTLNLTGTSWIMVAPEKILSLTIPNINITSGSSISADMKGYGTGAGPGAPTTVYDPNNLGPYYAGASYGGKGGIYAKPIYGSKIAPVDFGSGGNGYNYTRGGGAIRLVVSGTLSNDGVISAGGDVTSSGGSVYITANNITGGGTFTAYGGGPYCGGSCYPPGGGGRVAVFYKTFSFTGKILASGVNSGAGSSEDGTVYITSQFASLPSSAKQITSFNFSSLVPAVTGNIDESNHTISLTVPFNTDVTALGSVMTISDKASINPNNNTMQNFSSPMTYTVTAEDGSVQDYVVTVTVAPDPNTPPSITDYLLNGKAESIITNPIVNHLPLLFTASKNVDWVSIKIENQDDSSIFNYFKEGANCANGTNTCAKTWDGLLAGDVSAPSGTYKIKVKIRDLVTKVEYDFFSPYLITVNTN